MSRTRAKTDPYWAVSLVKMKPNVQTSVRGLWTLIQKTPEIRDVFWLGRGWGAGSSEHESGRALDLMFVENVGMRPNAKEKTAMLQMVDFLTKNAGKLGIYGIIVSRDGKNRSEIWGYSQPGKWRSLGDRGSVTANHIDHIHINFLPGTSWPSSVTFGGRTVSSSVGLPNAGSNTKPVAKPTGKTVPPYPVGIGPNKKNPSAVNLQRQLKKAGFMPSYVREHPNYGPRTQTAVAVFHNAHPQFRERGKTWDVTIGPKGWNYLFTRW